MAIDDLSHKESDRAASDRQRHREKVRQAIRENIGDIIAEEAIIGKSGDRTVKVPIRGVKEYQFVYGDNVPGVGQGDGSAKPGQKIGSINKDRNKNAGPAGNQPGDDYYETEITIDDLIDIMFEDLELPYLEQKKLREIESLKLSKPKGYRRVGIEPRRDDRKSYLQKKRREIAANIPPATKEIDEEAYLWLSEEERRFYEPVGSGMYRRRFPFHRQDLRYHHQRVENKPESNAVVICIMDTSGSMDTIKKYLARSFFFLLHAFLTTKYRNVEIVFIAHHTEAREVTEEEFFHKGESGGTMISSGYKKALEVIAARYSPALWNIYAFHCSDGENFDGDNDDALARARDLANICNLFGYGEIKPRGLHVYESSMISRFRAVEQENFVTLLIEEKSDVWTNFKQFMRRGGEEL